jgi:ABC-type amino acid transport substrate-binding protein
MPSPYPTTSNKPPKPQPNPRFWSLVLGILLICLQGIEAKTVKIGFDAGLAPFSDVSTRSGLEVEMLRAAFQSQGWSAEAVFLPNARISPEYQAGRLDLHSSAGLTEPLRGLKAPFPISAFNNQAISLQKVGSQIQAIQDLKNFRIIAWQGAKNYLGPDFRAMALSNPKYQELAHMPSQMLFLNRADVFISQPDVFRANLVAGLKPAKAAQKLQQLHYTELFSTPNFYTYAFANQQVLKTYLQGIKTIYQNGTMDKIYGSYLQKFGTSREVFISLECRFRTPKLRPKCPTWAQNTP